MKIIKIFWLLLVGEEGLLVNTRDPEIVLLQIKALH